MCLRSALADGALYTHPATAHSLAPGMRAALLALLIARERESNRATLGPQGPHQLQAPLLGTPTTQPNPAGGGAECRASSPSRAREMMARRAHSRSAPLCRPRPRAAAAQMLVPLAGGGQETLLLRWALCCCRYSPRATPARCGLCASSSWRRCANTRGRTGARRSRAALQHDGRAFFAHVVPMCKVG
jgi:hypothetical protein